MQQHKTGQSDRQMNEENRGRQPNTPPARLNEGAVVEMLPAYVLGALEAEEMLAVDDFLAAHPALLARVAELEAAADHLALAAPEVEPPTTAKTGLMARVQADAGVRSMLSAMDTQSVGTPSPAPAPVRPVQPPPLPRPIPQAETPPGWMERLRGFLGGNFFWPSLAMGTLAALLVVAVYATQTDRSASAISAQLNDAQQRIAQLEGEMNSLVQINQQLEQQLTTDRNQLAIFANAERVVALAGTPDAPDASGVFYTGPESGLLVLRNLPALSAEQTYELWLIPGEGAPVPAGLVQVAADGSNTFAIALAGQPTDYTAVGLSIEPAGGSPSPTGPIVLLGTVG
ncbi:MAG: anti-sigma factor [Caldilineaceae bacterium]|nr:anti-sigma factor [Caldilineaceae bacterium]